jgi:hypothetical protein
VSVWHVPPSAPDVTIMHGAEGNYLLGMTPAETMALAANLVRAAGTPGRSGCASGHPLPAVVRVRPVGHGGRSHERVARSAGHQTHLLQPRKARAECRATVTPPCEEGNYVTLISSEGGVPEISISHGHDALPTVTLADARDFALNILELINTVRTCSPQG